jgi:hypothetical protein
MISKSIITNYPQLHVWQFSLFFGLVAAKNAPIFDAINIVNTKFTNST